MLLTVPVCVNEPTPWWLERLPTAGCNTLATWQILNRVGIIFSHLDSVLLICPTKVLIEITGNRASVKYSIVGLPSVTQKRDCGGKSVLVRGLITFQRKLAVTCLLGWEAFICNDQCMVTFNKAKEKPKIVKHWMYTMLRSNFKTNEIVV